MLKLLIPFMVKKLKITCGVRQKTIGTCEGLETLSVEVEGGWIDWWYTRNKWMFQGEMFYGRKPNWLTQLIQEKLQAQ